MFHVRNIERKKTIPVLLVALLVFPTIIITTKYNAWSSLLSRDEIDCPAKTTPSVQRSDVEKRSQLLTYPNARRSHRFFQDNSTLEGFLPAITSQDRLDFLWMYFVVADALHNASIPFFFTYGSLLGVWRFEGMIPWDTDLDLGVLATNGETIREILSCLDGFLLITKHVHTHWKFVLRHTDYPFIDLFLYYDHEEFLWERGEPDTVHYKQDVFPLTTALYEGVQVPVPANVEEFLRLEYGDLRYCVTQPKHFKTFLPNPKANIPCSDMTNVYPFKNLQLK